jgi:cell division septation protein DedD
LISLGAVGQLDPGRWIPSHNRVRATPVPETTKSMADDNRFRSTRPGDSHRRAAGPLRPSERASGSDPLAELARLIGKNDPYAEFGLSNSAPEQHEENHSAAASAPDDRQHASQERYEEPYHQRYEEPYHRSDSARGRDSFAASREGYKADQDLPPADDAGADSWRTDGGPVYHEPQFEDDPQRPQYARSHDAEDDYAAEHAADHYVDGEAPLDPHEEQIYDDAPRARRHGGLATALALIGCAMLGTAGAYAYRSYYGQPAATALPPVITADNSTPTKLVPAPVGDAQPGKIIQDRLANAGREQIVSKQEEPVALKDIGTQAAPRVVLPAPVAPAPAGAVQTPLGSGANGSNEPKKVRTLTIRPDGTDVSGRPVVAAPATQAPPAARGSAGPLLLDPQAKEPASAPAAKTRVVRAPTATRTGPEPASSSSGGFLVQLSSQKTEAEAGTSFRSLQAKFPNELGGKNPIIRRADLGTKGVFYRTMVGPFASAQEAKQFCASYKAAGGHCVVPNN